MSVITTLVSVAALLVVTAALVFVVGSYAAQAVRKAWRRR